MIKEPKIKADDFVTYDDEEIEIQEKFTNFEELKITVEVLKDTLDEITLILRQNDLIKIIKTDAPYFDLDEVYKRLNE